MGFIKEIGKYLKTNSLKALDLLSDETSLDLMNLCYKTAEGMGYKIHEVPGNSVSSDAIAEVDFDRYEIETPDHGKPGRADPIKAYELGHEVFDDTLFKEDMGRLANETEHAMGEKNYLEWLEKNGYVPELLMGLGMHKLRNKFSKNNSFRKIRSWVEKQIDKYRDYIDGWAIPRLREAYALDV